MANSIARVGLGFADGAAELPPRCANSDSNGAARDLRFRLQSVYIGLKLPNSISLGSRLSCNSQIASVVWPQRTAGRALGFSLLGNVTIRRSGGSPRRIAAVFPGPVFFGFHPICSRAGAQLKL